MDKKEIGELIKKYRKKSKITQDELAERIERTKSTIAKYEKGLVDIPFPILNKLIWELQIPHAEMFQCKAYDFIADNKRNLDTDPNNFYKYLESIGVWFINTFPNGKDNFDISILMTDHIPKTENDDIFDGESSHDVNIDLNSLEKIRIETAEYVRRLILMFGTEIKGKDNGE